MEQNVAIPVPLTPDIFSIRESWFLILDFFLSDFWKNIDSPQLIWTGPSLSIFEFEFLRLPIFLKWVQFTLEKYSDPLLLRTSILWQSSPFQVSSKSIGVSDTVVGWSCPRCEDLFGLLREDEKEEIAELFDRIAGKNVDQKINSRFERPYR